MKIVLEQFGFYGKVDSRTTLFSSFKRQIGSQKSEGSTASQLHKAVERKMTSILNCSSRFNNSENQRVCASNVNDMKVPLSPIDKVAAFSIVYGVLFLVSVVGKQMTDARTNFTSKQQYDGMKNYVLCQGLRNAKNDRALEF